MHVRSGDGEEKGQGHVPRGRERACVATFNQIVSLIGDVDDRQRRPVTDSCHSPSTVARLMRGESGGPAAPAPPLSYQHLQPYLRRPIHHIIMPFTSPLQMPVTFSYYQAEKRSIPTYFSSKTAFPRVSNKRKFSWFAEFGGRATFGHLARPPARLLPF